MKTTTTTGLVETLKGLVNAIGYSGVLELLAAQADAEATEANDASDYRWELRDELSRMSRDIGEDE